MANNYCDGSSLLTIPDRIDRDILKQFIDGLIGVMEDSEEPGYCDCRVELVKEGVWFHSDESLTPEHVEIIARAIIDKFEIDEVFYCSWAHACSKPRVDEFGGGAFVMKRGFKTYWVDAFAHVQDRFEKGLLEPEDPDTAATATPNT